MRNIDNSTESPTKPITGINLLKIQWALSILDKEQIDVSGGVYRHLEDAHTAINKATKLQIKAETEEKSCAICKVTGLKLFNVYLYDDWGASSTETEVCLNCYASSAGTKLKRR